MSYSELQEWSEYLGSYPLHEDRNEIQLAVLTQVQASSEKKKYSHKDFLISMKNQERQELSGEELNEYILKAMA